MTPTPKVTPSIIRTLQNSLMGGAAKIVDTDKLPKRQRVMSVSSKAGKRGRYGRRIIAHKQVEKMRQVGIRWANGESHPLVVRYVEHSYLHATKGWRTYTNPFGMPGPRTSHMANACRSHGRAHVSKTYDLRTNRYACDYNHGSAV